MIPVWAIIIIVMFFIIVWLLYRKPNYPIDNKRRPLLNDEKIAVIEKTIKKFGYARCWHCGSKKDLDYDHILPLGMNGTNAISNLQLLCEKCNSKKGDRYVG